MHVYLCLYCKFNLETLVMLTSILSVILLVFLYLLGEIFLRHAVVYFFVTAALLMLPFLYKAMP